MQHMQSTLPPGKGIVDVDSHVTEPPDLSTTRVSKKSVAHGRNARLLEESRCGDGKGELQPRLSIWVGRVGENRTLRTVARDADGWDAYYLPPERYVHLNAVIDEWCDVEHSDPATLACSVNLVFAVRDSGADVETVLTPLPELRRSDDKVSQR